MSTILEAVVERGAPLDMATAKEQILALLRQVGNLEMESAARLEALGLARRQISGLADRNAAQENGIKAISAKCYWREVGSCDLACGGRAFCDPKGLAGFEVREGLKDHRLEACATGQEVGGAGRDARPTEGA
jgi:hypothetical protein